MDGELRWRGPGPGGGLDTWDHTYPLILGNESTGDRPWLGRLVSVVIYDRALEPDEALREAHPSMAIQGGFLREECRALFHE